MKLQRIAAIKVHSRLIIDTRTEKTKLRVYKADAPSLLDCTGKDTPDLVPDYPAQHTFFDWQQAVNIHVSMLPLFWLFL